MKINVKLGSAILGLGLNCYLAYKATKDIKEIKSDIKDLKHEMFI